MVQNRGEQILHSVTWLSISCDVEPRHRCQSPFKLISRDATSVQSPVLINRVHDIEQRKDKAETESKNSYLNQELGPTFRVIAKAQILYTNSPNSTGNKAAANLSLIACTGDGPVCDQMEASFF